MAITPFGSFSVTFANLATKISGQAATVKGYFDSIGNDIKTYINDTLIPALSSTADGSSGADQIGATSIPGLTGNTVQALLESAKEAINEHLADNASLTAKGHVQLQTSVDTSESKALTPKALNNHLADNVEDSDGVHGLKLKGGTFTPFLAGSTTAGTNTYSNQTGNYYKIGHLVIARFNIVLSAKDAAMSGNVYIGGLPFVCENGGEFNPTFAQIEGITLDAAYTHVSGFTTGYTIQLIQAKGTWNNLTSEALANNTKITGLIVYTTNG